ncbi:MAG: HEPN domain-containing protein [Treponemataceae bacterium]|nr:MAG: HEPN domain-containing protein [Treponemataceae bacterium]
MDKATELAQWFFMASEDLKSSEYLATMHYPRPEGIICFHCQQCAEKNLKAFLFQNDVDFPKIHDLLKLLELCRDIDVQFSTILPQCNFLNRYSVIPRYPDELEITAENTNNALQYARDIRDFVKAKIATTESDAKEGVPHD